MRSRSRSRSKSVKSRSKSRSKGKLKLIKIVPSHRKEKKYDAYFSDGRVIPFGAAGYQNYGGVGKAKHLDEERKRRYIERHKDKENWNDPQTPGSLSRWVLWNKSTFRESVADYKRRFNL